MLSPSRDEDEEEEDDYDYEDEDEEEDEELLGERGEAFPPAPRYQREPEAQPGMPFALEPHERVLLSGGFGGKFPWSWTISLVFACLLLFPFVVAGAWSNFSKGRVHFGLALLAMMAVFVFAAVWPFLRSGRYWLTNLCLYWKPRLGPAVAVPLSAIDPKRIAARQKTSSLIVRGQQPVSLRYVSDLERLWGGVILLSQLDAFEPPETGERTEDVACWPAECVEGMSSQQGMAVLRPEYFAFLPSQEKVNVVAEITSKVLNIDPGESLEAKLPVDLLLEVLHEQNPLSFDEYVYQVVEQHEGLVWEPGEADVMKEAFPLQPRRHVLIFAKKRCVVRGIPTREQGPFIDHVLRTWSEDRPIPVRQPIGRVVKVSLLFTVLAVLFAVGGHSLAANPQKKPWESWLAYGFAAVLGVLGLLCWVLTVVLMGRARRSPAGGKRTGN
jgi:hypothetical protein